MEDIPKSSTETIRPHLFNKDFNSIFPARISFSLIFSFPVINN